MRELHRNLTLICAILFCLKIAAHNCAAVEPGDDLEAAANISVTKEEFKAHCRARICMDMHYDSLAQTVVFDDEPEIIINDDNTYDIYPSLHTESLVFENSTFANFPLNLFTQIPLKELDLRNSSLQQMSVNSFRGAQSLNVLLLSENKLTDIPAGIFMYALNLQFLFLDDNLIANLASDCFEGLSRLRYLNLQQNRLSTLPTEVFKYLTSLTELNLSNNRLRTLDANIFKQNNKLQTLLLNGNEFTDIDFYLLFPIRKLELVDLSFNTFLESLELVLVTRVLLATNCNLKRVNVYGVVNIVDMSHNEIMELYFAQAKLLEELTVRDNALEQLTTLRNAQNLRYLDAADNARLGDDWYDDSFQMKLLERLDLSNTSLTALPVALVAANENLKRLNLANNRIKEINPWNFVYLKDLRHLHIHGNNWNCFNLRSVMDMLIKPQRITYVDDPVDAEFPGEYIGGIACMYRIETVDDPDNASSEERNAAILKEGEMLQNEMEVLARFYEQKVHHIQNILDVFKYIEKLNETMFQYITITV